MNLDLPLASKMRYLSVSHELASTSVFVFIKSCSNSF